MGKGIQLQGASGAFADVSGSTFRAMDVVREPLDMKQRGWFATNTTRGLGTGQAAGQPIIALYWTGPGLVGLTTVDFQQQALVAYTAGTLTDYGYDAFIRRGMNSKPTGASYMTSTGKNMKVRSVHASTTYINNSMPILAVTLTDSGADDAQPFANSIGDPQRINPNAATEEQYVNNANLLWRAGRGHPIILASGEGFIFRNRAVWPAAGTLQWTCRWSWIEIDAY